MRFGEIVTAVAVLVVVDVLLYFVFMAAFIPVVGSYSAADVASILSVLIAGLIVGFLFGGQIREARLSSVGRIAVLSSVVMMFAMMALFTNPYMGRAMQEGLTDMYATSGWATWDWVAYAQMVMVMIVAINVVFALVFGFIGLYVGSLLRGSGKT